MISTIIYTAKQRTKYMDIDFYVKFNLKLTKFFYVTHLEKINKTGIKIFFTSNLVN